MTYPKKEQAQSRCLNCSSEISLDAKYCYNCGAHQSKNELTTKEVFIELFDVIIIWNKDFFKTFFHLVAKPAKTAGYYIDGGRKRYMNPLLYMLFSFFLYVLILSFTGGEMIFIEGMKEMASGANREHTEYLARNPSEIELDSQPEYIDIDSVSNLNRFSKILFFLTLPIMAITSILFFKSSGMKFAGHLVVNAFLMSQLMMIGIITIPLTLFEPSIQIISSIPKYFILLYIIYYQYKVFDGKILISILKSIGFILISLFITIIVFYFIILIAGRVF